MNQDDPFAWTSHLLAEKYRIDSPLASGGFGIIYRAHHLTFDTPVAVKFLRLPATLLPAERAHFEQAFLSEARILHRLSKATSAIVQALDLGVAVSPSGAWTPYVVLEWLDGRTLEEDLDDRRRRRLGSHSLGAAMHLLEPVAHALKLAHEMGVAHRDVKPANLFRTQIGSRETVKVLDFGVAKIMGDPALLGRAYAATGDTSSLARTQRAHRTENVHRRPPEPRCSCDACYRLDEMRAEIEARFKANLRRADHLVTAYNQVAGTGGGRATVTDTDILRAAVVFVHATMEELLRAVLSWKLPTGNAAAFKNVSFPGVDTNKVSLEELAAYRGMSIDALFHAAVDQHLRRSNYNNSRDVGAALERAGLDPTPILDQHGAEIDSITSRRHLIVHRADANPVGGSGHHLARSLSVSTVRTWIQSIEGFGKDVLDAC